MSAHEELTPYGRRLSGWNLATWRAAAGDPHLRSPIGGIALLAHAPDVDRLAERAERVTRLAPVLRQKVAEPLLGLGEPRMVVDKHFDPTLHISRVVMPPPGSWRQLLDHLRRLSVTDFDADRPLWRASLVEGLQGGHAALALVVHHAVADGQGLVMLLAGLVDWTAEPPADDQQLPAVPPPGRSDPLSVTATAWASIARRGVETGWGVGKAVPRLGLRALRAPVRTAGEAASLAASAVRLAEPHRTPLSPVMTGRSTVYRFSTLDVPFEALRAAAKAHDGTINDAFLAAVMGGMRRYHEEHGVSLGTLRFNVPVSLRDAGASAATNAVTVVRLELDCGITDPTERMSYVHAAVEAARDEPALSLSDDLADLSSFLPLPVISRTLRASDVTASNVPGPPAPLWLGGAPVERLYPAVATIGAAVNVTLLSYARRWASLGITTDDAAVTDPDVLLRCLIEGFQEVDVAVPPTATDPLATTPVSGSAGRTGTARPDKRGNARRGSGSAGRTGTARPDRSAGAGTMDG